MPLHHFRHTVPIFDAYLNIVFCNNVRAAREEMGNLLGESTLGDKECFGLCEWDGRGNYMLVFDLEHLTNGLIAHEVSHLTSGILETEGIEDDETRSLIVGYCTKIVYGFVKKGKVKIK